jgi:hypothetical protein
MLFRKEHSIAFDLARNAQAYLESIVAAEARDGVAPARLAASRREGSTRAPIHPVLLLRERPRRV